VYEDDGQKSTPWPANDTHHYGRNEAIAALEIIMKGKKNRQ